MRKESRKDSPTLCDNPHCAKPIRAGQEQSALKCAEVGCKRTCHRQRKCSAISRYEENPVWHCLHHNPNPTPESSILRRPAYAEKSTDKCAKCKLAIRKNAPRIICGECDKPFHLKHTGIVGRAAQEQFIVNPKSWICSGCMVSNIVPHEEEVLRPDASETKSGYFRDQVNIMQWNANAISTKLVELRCRLHDSDIDVCLIQESKLEKGSPDPKIKGYVTMRDDRKTHGGGLVAFVRDTIKCEKLARNVKNGTEVASLRVKLRKKEWLKLTNVYVRPENSEGDETIMETDLIPADSNSVICGDFNAHTNLWDPIQPVDDRGEELLDWTLENNLSILNDGISHTRLNPGSDLVGKSVPDVTCCGSAWRGKAEWRVGAPIGSSDHLPIIITLTAKVNHQEPVGAVSRWKRSGVDWKLFGSACEEEFKKRPTGKSIKDRVELFNSILVDVGKKVVGKTKPGKRTSCWMNPVVKAKIKTRNRLYRTVKENRTEWIDACRAVNQALDAAKEEGWRDLLQDAVTDADEGKIWGIIKSLNGSTSSNAPNVAMVHKGKTVTCNRKKADIFMQHYASVSKLKFSKEERALNRSMKKLLSKPTVGDSNCTPFTMRELDKAIKSMRAKGAAGPDDVPPPFLKALGPFAKSELLDIFNQSFLNGELPQIWRLAWIIPLLKADKSPSDLASFRPVSLTSCIVKLLERMIANRIYTMAEQKGWLHAAQAGFRKGRSCEDQITRVIQSINDGLNSVLMKRSVLVLLDFSKAYDTVWRQKLLVTLDEMGLPVMYTKWLRAFLENRQARVRFNNTLGGTRTVHQGLPQGSVLAPLLFICYINSLAEELPTDTVNAMFADDVAILATSRDRSEAEAVAQASVDIVSRWSKEWKLNLNATKSEVSFFSNWTWESGWEPTIEIDGKKLAFQPFPRLLGVTLDRELTFGEQTAIATKAAGKSCRVLAALANTSYGVMKQDLVPVFHAVVKSKLDYSGPAWQANLCDTNREKLDVAQNKALRIITGQFKDSPLDSLRRETGVPSYYTHMDRNILKSREKALRFPADHPRRIARDNAVPKRLVRHSWRSKGDELASSTALDSFSKRKDIVYHTLAPWDDGVLCNVYSKVPGLLNGRQEKDVLKRRDLSYKRIREIAAEYVIYSDGSAAEGTLEGGAGVVVTFGEPDDPTVVDTLMKRGSAITCSFSEEATALEMSLDWIKEHCVAETKVAICTDSQSLCEALLGCGDDVAALRGKLLSAEAQIQIQWIPGHSKIAGNDLADSAAKEATTLQDDPTEITYKSACAYIRSTIKDTPSHERTAEVYAEFSRKKEKEVRTRADQTMLARIRSGHHWCLESYHKLVDPDHDA